MEKKGPNPRYITRQAADGIISKLNWRYEEWMQDWPLEISQEINIKDCLQEYKNLQSDDEKFVLMQGILYALDEETTNSELEYYWKEISELLIKDFKIHEYTIFYWGLYEGGENEDPATEGFRITPLMQEIWNKNNDTTTKAKNH
ncbi:hypothetical protein I5M27_09180 [Adhaeribacter sp. BT258]|uniref:Uncharacterized protein n=1 Tax=Adhaeribacter terrigena TaxID=2793070 RepID=A0ABS1C179_9BACT|nr:hypothetical protein [Adhaeribacter terrigena]MBK0403156.1 hypothetical protein [Adhaeribacter terrigena]